MTSLENEISLFYKRAFWKRVRDNEYQGNLGPWRFKVFTEDGQVKATAIQTQMDKLIVLPEGLSEQILTFAKLSLLS